MITSVFTDEQFSSMSQVNAKVEIYEGSTLVRTCTCSNHLSDYSITREGDTGKFFGFGICHKLNLVLIDLEREISLFTNYTIKIALGSFETDIWDYPYPTFYVNEIDRNEKDNTITVTAYDKMHDLNAHRFEELFITAPYTLKDITNATANKFLNASVVLQNVGEDAFALSYADGANLEGTEELRGILNAIAEVTLTVYFINHNNDLVFKRLKTPDNDTDITITPNEYYELNVMTPRTLTAICSATELGDNLTATAPGLIGVTQYIRNNPFLDLRSDRATLLDNAIALLGGFTIYQFDLDWSADYRLEIGDLIGLVTNHGQTVYSYVLSDTIEYAGTLNEIIQWEYNDNSEETASNPTSIKEAIDRTYAKVDKMQKEIILYVGEVVDTVVEDRIDTAVNNSIDNFNEKFNQIQASVDAANGKIDSVEDDISGLQEVQLQHSERFSKLELDTQSINATVSSLTETTEVLKTDIDEAKQEAIDDAIAESNKLIEENNVLLQQDITAAQENAIAEANSNSQQLVDLLSGQLESDIDTAEKEAKDYTDEKVTILSQTINQKEASIKVTTDAITQRVAATEEVLLTKVDANDVYSKTEVYTKEETDSQIQVAKDEINLSVSETYETKATVTQKISTAKTEILNEAADDATTKANSAKSEAITESATDAQNKADAAEKDANDYTDSRVTTVITTIDEKVAEINVTTDGITQRVEHNETKTSEIESDIEELNSNVTSTSQALSALELNTSSITASVQSMQKNTTTNLENITEELNSITKRLDTTMTTDQVEIKISETLNNGVDRVTTSTGFTFNDAGLHISKSNSQMESLLDETGLLVSRYDTPVLVAQATGVNALNLTSRQYLKVAGSRFEKMGTKRTACFWVGD